MVLVYRFSVHSGQTRLKVISESSNIGDGPATHQFLARRKHFPAAAVDFVKFCAASICFVALLVALIVAGVIAAATILVFVATVVSLIIVIAVAVLVAATCNLLRRFVFVCCFQSFVLIPYWAQLMEPVESTPAANTRHRAASRPRSGSVSSVESMDAILIHHPAHQHPHQSGVRDPSFTTSSASFTLLSGPGEPNLLAKHYRFEQISVSTTSRTSAVTLQ